MFCSWYIEKIYYIYYFVTGGTKWSNDTYSGKNINNNNNNKYFLLLPNLAYNHRSH